jgi:hypothetical protein
VRQLGSGVGESREKDLFSQVRVADMFGGVRGRMCQAEGNCHRARADPISLRLESGSERHTDEIRCSSVGFSRLLLSSKVGLGRGTRCPDLAQ